MRISTGEINDVAADVDFGVGYSLIEIDELNVYWVKGDILLPDRAMIWGCTSSPSIYRSPIEGGPTEVLEPNLAGCAPIAGPAVSEGSIYFSPTPSATTPLDVRKCVFADSSCDCVDLDESLNVHGDVHLLQIDGRLIVTGFTEYNGSEPELWALPLDLNTQDATIIASTPGSIHCIAAGSDALYWTERDYSQETGGRVMKLSVPDSNPSTRATGQTDPGAIVVGPTHIYWLNWGVGAEYNDNALMRTLK